MQKDDLRAKALELSIMTMGILSDDDRNRMLLSSQNRGLSPQDMLIKMANDYLPFLEDGAIQN